MVRVTFPAGMQRHQPCPPVDVTGRTVRQALEAAFAIYPAARGYVLDDGGALRPHVAIFVDGRPVQDRARLALPIDEDADLLVVQALSGG